MVCETTTRYFGNMELCTAEGKKLEENTFSVLETYIDLWQHVYQITIIIVLKLHKRYS
jgi:hypothetical protein